MHAVQTAVSCYVYCSLTMTTFWTRVISSSEYCTVASFEICLALAFLFLLADGSLGFVSGTATGFICCFLRKASAQGGLFGREANDVALLGEGGSSVGSLIIVELVAATQSFVDG